MRSCTSKLVSCSSQIQKEDDLHAWIDDTQLIRMLFYTNPYNLQIRIFYSISGTQTSHL